MCGIKFKQIIRNPLKFKHQCQYWYFQLKHRYEERTFSNSRFKFDVHSTKCISKLHTKIQN